MDVNVQFNPSTLRVVYNPTTHKVQTYKPVYKVWCIRTIAEKNLIYCCCTFPPEVCICDSLEVGSVIRVEGTDLNDGDYTVVGCGDHLGLLFCQDETGSGAYSAIEVEEAIVQEGCDDWPNPPYSVEGVVYKIR